MRDTKKSKRSEAAVTTAKELAALTVRTGVLAGSERIHKLDRENESKLG